MAWSSCANGKNSWFTSQNSSSASTQPYFGSHALNSKIFTYLILMLYQYNILSSNNVSIISFSMQNSLLTTFWPHSSHGKGRSNWGQFKVVVFLHNDGPKSNGTICSTATPSILTRKLFPGPQSSTNPPGSSKWRWWYGRDFKTKPKSDRHKNKKWLRIAKHNGKF